MARLGSSQFRENAVIRNAEPESLDERAQLTAPREWAVLAFFAAAVAALVVWGLFGSLERTLRSGGVLVISGERRTLLSGVSGEVAEIVTPEGERAAAGQAIVRIALSEMERRVRSAAASVRRLENEAKGAASAGSAETRQLLTSVRAMLDELAALQGTGAVASPADGVVAAILVAPGQTLPVGAPIADIVFGGGGVLEAVAFAAPGDSWVLTPGMEARVRVESPGGGRLLPARLVSITPRASSPPAWLARMRPDAAARGPGHVLRFAITDPAGLDPPAGSPPGGRLEDGTPCRIEIVLEHTSPFGLLLRSPRRGVGRVG